MFIKQIPMHPRDSLKKLNKIKSLFYTSITVFSGKTIIQKLQMGASTGHLRNPIARRPEHQMIGRSGGVRGTQNIQVFKIQLRNILNLPWQVTQDFIVNCGSEIFSEQYSNLNNEN